MKKNLEVKCDKCLTVFSRQKVNVDRSRALNNGDYLCAPCKHSLSSEYKGVNVRKGTPIHNSFAGAKQRCRYSNHKSFKYYGGRGILFRWESFYAFLEDMFDTYKDGLTLDRIDSNKDYCKENCRWATHSEQARNTRRNIHTYSSIREIRMLYKEGATQVFLAKKFNDSQGNISNIINGKTWIEGYEL